MKMYFCDTMKNCGVTTNLNVPKLEWNLSSHVDTLIKLADFEKVLKLTKKMVKAQEKITLTQS